MDESSFSSLEPIEVLIARVQILTIVTSGTADKSCTPAFLNYLRSIASGNSLVHVRELVMGARHEVTDSDGPEVAESYGKALFC